MKRIWFLILVVALFPIITYAKTPTKEELMNTIQQISNVQVEENTKILSTVITEDQIQLIIEENGIRDVKSISYEYHDDSLFFSSGTIDMKVVGDKLQEVSMPVNNEYAFYLYLILENMSTSPYEEDNYYNNTNIKKKLESLSKEELTNFIGTNYQTLNYKNSDNTFGLVLIRESNENNKIRSRIYYQYNLAGDETILPDTTQQGEGFENPSTGSYGFFVTMLLLIVMGIAGYTYYDMHKKPEDEVI